MRRTVNAPNAVLLAACDYTATTYAFLMTLSTAAIAPTRVTRMMKAMSGCARKKVGRKHEPPVPELPVSPLGESEDGALRRMLKADTPGTPSATAYLQQPATPHLEKTHLEPGPGVR